MIHRVSKVGADEWLYRQIPVRRLQRSRATYPYIVTLPDDPERDIDVPLLRDAKEIIDRYYEDLDAGQSPSQAVEHAEGAVE